MLANTFLEQLRPSWTTMLKQLIRSILKALWSEMGSWSKMKNSEILLPQNSLEEEISSIPTLPSPYSINANLTLNPQVVS